MAQQIKTKYWEDTVEGEELPPLERDITATLIAVGAISATRDFYPVHHDAAFAKASGAQDIFMNILTTGGILGKFLTDWSGPEGEIKKISMRLMVPNYPGDRMKVTGRVEKRYQEGDQHLVQVALEATNSMGPHVQATAIMALPTKG